MMSNVQHKQRKNQAAAAALARSLAFHSARKSFISALTLTIRGPTPLYFLMTPVTVLVYRTLADEALQLFVGAQAQHLFAAAGSIPFPEIEKNDIEQALEFKGSLGRKHGYKLFRDVVGGATRRRLV